MCQIKQFYDANSPTFRVNKACKTWTSQNLGLAPGLDRCIMHEIMRSDIFIRKFAVKQIPCYRLSLDNNDKNYELCFDLDK